MAVADKAVVVGTDGDSGGIYSFEIATGRLRWGRRFGRGVLTDIVVSGAFLFAVTYDDEIVCLDLRTGDLIWKFPGGESAAAMSMIRSAPVVINDLVIFGSRSGFLYALDRKSGKSVWSVSLGSPVSTNILARGDELFLGTGGSKIYKVHVRNGEVVAFRATNGYPYGSVVSSGDLVFSLSKWLNYRTAVSCFDSDLKTRIWLKALSRPEKWSSPRLYLFGTRIILGNNAGDVVFMNRETGAVVDEIRLGGTVRGIGFSEDVIYVGTLEGTVYAYRMHP